MHQLFFRTFATLFLFLLLVISASTYFWSKSVYLDQIEKNLSQNIDSLLISLNSLENLDYIIKTFKSTTKLRITIINKDGIVIADSDKEYNLMENHLNREEIVEANTLQYGKQVRYSETLKQELLYVAKKIKIGNDTYFIRLADYTSKIQENFTNLSFQILFFISLFMLIAFVITYFLSIKIKTETDSILKYLSQLSNKKPNYELNSSFSQEFYRITKLLNKVAQRLSKREKEKNKQNAKLKLSNRQKDEIISAVSHEFNNPIAIITGYCETILNDEELPKEIKSRFLKKIHSNSIKMSNMIDRLRLTAKLEEGKQELLTKECSIKNICFNVISDLQDKYKNREIQIKGDDYNIKADETLLYMAISNLVENALKYSQDEVKIEISANSIKIIDQGIGIDNNDLDKINRKFYRVSKNGWDNSLGLGLFIVYSIVKLHKFQLKINTKLGAGSEFTIKY